MKKLNHDLPKIKLLLLVLFTSFNGTIKAQLPFKYDSLYKTMYAKEFCSFIQKNPDVVLIDVRTAGEFSDTSHFASLNKGHLKGAININIDSIKNNIRTLDSYKDKTMVFYCSHSQRSRRVSKLLSENGYTNCYNLNGGMTSLNELNSTDFPCKQDWIVTNLKFKNLSFDQAADLLQKEKNLLIVDVRPVNQYNSNDTIQDNNVGRIKGSINIPYDQFKNRWSELLKYKNQPVLIYSTSGDGDGSRAATDLTNNGFTNVNLLLAGINDFIASRESSSFIENGTPFISVDAYRTLKLLKENKNLIVFDTRVSEEYDNKVTGMAAYKNLGHIKNSIHTEKQHFTSAPLPDDRIAPVLIYGNEEAYEFASYLTTQGFKKVFLLNSFYDFVWSSFNVENCKEAKLFLTDHAGLY